MSAAPPQPPSDDSSGADPTTPAAAPPPVDVDAAAATAAPPTSVVAPAPITPSPMPPPPPAYEAPRAQTSHQLSSVGKLFGAYLLDQVLITVTLGIGWLIWGAITAGDAQTPAKKLLGMRVVDANTGAPLSWGAMVGLRGIVGGLVMGVAFALFIIPGAVLAFMPLWDDRNQSVWSKVSTSVVVDV